MAGETLFVTTFGKSHPLLEDSRLFLALERPDDAAEMIRAMRPDAMKNFAFFEEQVTAKRQATYLYRMARSPTDFLFTIRTRRKSRCIGTVGLHEYDAHDRMVRIGCIIFQPRDRRKGYGHGAIELALQYAFEVLKVNKVYLNVFHENTRAQAIYARMGFRPEGVLLEEYLLDGKFHDMVRMCILARWREATPTT